MVQIDIRTIEASCVKCCSKIFEWCRQPPFYHVLTKFIGWTILLEGSALARTIDNDDCLKFEKFILNFQTWQSHSKNVENGSLLVGLRLEI